MFEVLNATSPRAAAGDETKGKHVSLSEVMEGIGLTAYHWRVVTLVWVIWALCGWTATSIVFLLDAAGERDSDWVQLTSPEDVMTMGERSLALLGVNAMSCLANIVGGNLSDMTGRIWVSEIMSWSSFLAAIGFMLARKKEVLTIVILLCPFTKDGLCSITGCLLAEWLPVHYRCIFLVSLHGVWNIGRFGVTALWLCYPPDEYWVEFCAAVSLFPLSVAFFMHWQGRWFESPRWLAVNGDSEGCIALLRLAAESKPPKDQKLPRGWDDPARLALDANSAAVTTKASSQNWHGRLSELMQPELRFLVCVCGIWTFGLFFVSQGLLYWLITYFKKIGAGAAVSPSMMAAPIAKIVANIALMIGGPGRCIVDSCPRVPLLQAGFIGFAFFISLLAATTNTYALVGIVFMSQIFEEIVWTIGGVYVTEAFPTAVRASGQGAVMALGNCGAIASAGLVGLLMEIWVYLPIVAMASLLCACCLATFLMKEIFGEALTDSVPVPSYGAAETPEERMTREMDMVGVDQ
ncbi:unnamed protein product [Polarella glacialis]|uniref:Uncharacterized protein n=1 Tax=Polarella glacialis TaxID=89957 RepID=A0A813LUT9_POLGL|nr:unnamed protein product [Polarella glacialis]